MDDIPVYISDECCVGIVTLFDKENGMLEKQKSHCTDIVLESMLINTEQYCNDDLSECEIDFHDFQCDDRFAETCLDLGGRLYEADVVLECTDFTESFKFTLKNDVRCLSPMCSDDEMLSIFDALERNPDLGQCEVTVFPKEMETDSSESSSSTSSSASAQAPESGALLKARTSILMIAMAASSVLAML